MDLITQRVSAKDIGLPEWATKALKKHGVKKEDAQLIRKGITPEDTKFKEGERSSVDYITTKAIDRDGEIVVPSGAILDHYRKNPVVLFGHDYKSLPVGKSLWIKADEKGLISKTQYAKHQKAEDIFQYRKDGFPMAKSIGFIPLSAIEKDDFETADLKSMGLTKEDVDGANRIYPTWLMLEYSDVPVPSNPEALQLAVSKSILTMDQAKTLSKDAFVMEIIEPEEKAVIEIIEPKEKAVVEVVTADGEKITAWSSSEEADSSEAEGKAESDLEKRYGKEVKPDDSTPPEVEKEIAYTSLPYSFKAPAKITERWNKSLSKEFDVENADVPPSTEEYAMMKEWLECEVKEIYICSDFAPAAMIGTYLTGLKDSLSEYKKVTTRNFNWDGSESPPVYSVVQLTSKKSDDFLIRGSNFYEKDGVKAIIKRDPSWGGLDIIAYCKVEDRNRIHKIFSDTHDWADNNNFLKGEAFALSGKFIQKGGDDFKDIFLKSETKASLKRTVELINKKGKDLANRGIIMVGPPGTGKTMSGRAMMNNADSTFIWVTARDFGYTGAAGGIQYGFDLARKLAPSVLFMEDIDGWFTDRTVDLLKIEMDGIEKSNGVVTMLTSNFPEKLPEALIDRPGRFHDILNLDLPDAETRAIMIKAWATDVQEKSIEVFVDDTKGFSGAHMFELVAFAKTLMEDDEELSIDKALEISLNKIKEQRELINELRGKEFEVVEVPSKDGIWKSYERVLVEEKAGKVISKKNRTIIDDAVEAMGKAVSKLNELVEAVDSKEEADLEIEDEEIVLDISDEEVVEKEVALIDVDEDMIREVIGESFKSFMAGLRNSKKVDVDTIVKNSLDKAKGKVF